MVLTIAIASSYSSEVNPLLFSYVANFTKKTFMYALRECNPRPGGTLKQYSDVPYISDFLIFSEMAKLNVCRAVL